MVGLVFLSEGIQKFLFADTLGGGRFTKIGFPWPELTATLVGSFEIVCGLLLFAGIRSRLACLPLLVIISGAILTTKVPLLFSQGFWAMAHESRTDFCMVLGLCFILISEADSAASKNYGSEAQEGKKP
jgi:putative oxidoreductase